MAKKRASKSRKSGLYKAETYGIRYNSVTFLLMLSFVAVVAMVMLASAMGIKLY